MAFCCGSTPVGIILIPPKTTVLDKIAQCSFKKHLQQALPESAVQLITKLDVLIPSHTGALFCKPC